MSTSFFRTSVEFLKGVGPQKAALLAKELNIFTYGDLLQHYPFRYEDRSTFHRIRDLDDGLPHVQIRGRLLRCQLAGEGRSKRLVGLLRDETGEIELVWFQGIAWLQKHLTVGQPYVAFGKPNRFGHKISLPHPEMEPLVVNRPPEGFLQPVYSVTETLRKRFLDSRALSKLLRTLLPLAAPHLHETLPAALIAQHQFVSRNEALQHLHFPPSSDALLEAQRRLKFEELFFIQLKLLQQKVVRQETFRGYVFEKVDLLTRFYEEHLPFELTNAQKRVVREIFADLRSGQQMNRLLQGDVGSGKTIVAFICMLIAIGNGAQTCLMAPTEILADQHYQGLRVFAQMLDLRIAKLTGSTKKKERRQLHEALQAGLLHVLVGTHALIEDTVQFRQLGLCVIDEQHRFGVAQRAKLWQKNDDCPPHMLVMTATPIPRTLAMTLYGDLDVSVIDELPAGRKPIRTVHRYDKDRLAVFGFIREEIRKGRQVYIVYPLIEESEKLDYKDLMDGYESVARAFPEHQLSIVHGKMKAPDKDFEMQRFVRQETQILVATTVIEVGVNVPNASVMVIENAEKFGLSQLHQLRGRVGRGAEQSYCILMTDYKLSKEARVRINTMTRTTDGFEIAETDLKLRGPGDLMGTQQSGVLDLLVADLARDGAVLREARAEAEAVLAVDPLLTQPVHAPIRQHIDSLRRDAVNWSRIS